MNNKRRVVVTGIGIISCIGIGKERFWDALVSGKSGISKISSFDASGFPSRIAGEVRDFDPTRFITPKKIRQMDRFSQFATVASLMALEDARLKVSNSDNNVGTIIGSAVGGVPFAEAQHKIFLEKGLNKVYPLLAIRLFPGTGASQVSIELGLKGYGNTISTGCASGVDAIGNAFDAIKHNRADVCITGASEAPLSPLTFGSFCLIKVVSTRNDSPEKASRPFDKDRDGTVISEGAAILILEELEHALRRNANIYCEVIGYGTTYDGFHVAHPLPDGSQIAKAMQYTLKNSGIKSEQIDLICAHGSSTQLNDKIETFAIKQVFEKHAYKLLIPGIESIMGHALGACGALKAAATALMINTGKIIPTINYEFSDPECDLDYVPNILREKAINFALTNAYSFGGKNSVIAMKKFID